MSDLSEIATGDAGPALPGTHGAVSAVGRFSSRKLPAGASAPAGLFWESLTQAEDERLWAWRAKGVTFAVIERRITRERARVEGVKSRWARVFREAIRAERGA